MRPSIKAQIAPMMLPAKDAEYPTYNELMRLTRLSPQPETVAAIPTRKIPMAHKMPILKASPFTLSFSAIELHH